MKNFVKYVLILAIATIGLSYCFDILYTNMYYSETIRSKISWVKSDQFPDSLDYVLLGSSRSIHHLQPELIDSITKLNGLNLGYPASGPVEIKLMLNEILKTCKVKKVFVQVDHQYNDTLPDELAIVSWMPYIKEDDVYNEIKKYNNDYYYHRHIPFYRYQVYGPKIGFRNLSLIVSGKESDFIKTKGYIPLSKILENDTSFSVNMNDNQNRIFDEITDLCMKHNIEINFYTAPIYNNNVEFGPLKEHLPRYTDLSNSIMEKALFSDASHLNHQGATLFTKIFIQEFFNPSLSHDSLPD
ncbi:MAG: hypothetical protein Roseis2KO_49000 [Roseivirga sp.]